MAPPVPDVAMDTPLGNFPPLKGLVSGNDVVGFEPGNGQGYLDVDSQRMLISSNREMSRTIALQTQMISHLRSELGAYTGLSGPPTCPSYKHHLALTQHEMRMRQTPLPRMSTSKEQCRPTPVNEDLSIPPSTISRDEKAESSRLRQMEKAAEFELRKKLIETLEQQVQLTKSTFTEQLARIKDMLTKTIGRNSESDDRIQYLENEVSQIKASQMETAKDDKHKMDFIWKLQCRVNSLEEFRTKVVADETLKCETLGSLEKRMANIKEIGERLDDLDDFDPEETESAISDLKGRVGVLEGFKETVDVWDFDDLSATMEGLSSSVSEVKVTLDDIQERVGTLESDEDTWEAVNAQ